MKKLKNTKFYLLVISLVSVIAFIGCNDNSYDFIEYDPQNQTYFSKTGNVVDGIFVAPPQSPSGMSISAERDTFRSNTEITVTEKEFTGNGSSLLTNADTTFEIRGVVIFENPAIAPKELKSVEKPIKVVVPNTIRGNVNGYFLGMRDDENSPWKFKQINYDVLGDNPMTVSSVRANISGSEFTFYTSRLGFQFALFADLTESSLLSGVTVVENTVAEIKSNASDSKDIGKIKIKDNKYCENMKVCVKVSGKNVNKLTSMDYKPVLQYVNDNYSDNGQIFKNAKFDKVDNNSGTSDGYVHNVIVSDFDVDGETLSFVLNTDGVSVSEFPQNFVVTVKDAGNVNQTLPFEYTNSLTVEEAEIADPEKELAAPVNVVISDSKFYLGQDISISWDSGNPELENVVYDILLAEGNASETAVAASLTETVWTLEASENTLDVGSYSVRIAARNNEGKTMYSDSAAFYIVEDPAKRLAAPMNVTVSDSKFYLGQDISISWDSGNPDLENVVYDVLLAEGNASETVAAASLTETIWTVETSENTLSVGSYSVRIAVRNNEGKTLYSDSAVFYIVNVPAKRMVAPRNVIVSNSKFSLGQNITISWDSGNPELENVVYDVLMAKGNASETVAAASLTETIWTIDASENTLGVGSYSVRIAVRNNEGKTLRSDYAIFYIVDDTIPETTIIGLEPLYVAGESITIKWNEVKDPLGNSIIYSLWLWKSDEEVSSNSLYLGYEPSYVVRNIATGSYKVKVVATNGSKSSETGAIGEFKVIAFTKANISIDSSLIGDDGLYSRQSEFNISLSEKNFNKPDIEQAIRFEGSDGSIQPVMSWNDDVLNVKFNQLLTRNHTYKLSMNPCKDIYGNEISVFDEYQFTTFFFEGKGDLDEPYTWETQPDIFAKTPEGEIPLIGTVTVDITEVFHSFTDIRINETATILNGSEVIWADMPLAMELNKISVGIGNENLWTPSQNIDLKVRFSAQHNGKTICFETASKAYKTESGKVITMGSGTSEKPYLVYTADQLNDIRNHLDSDISLIRDIDLAGYFPEGGSESEGWQPIGEYVNESQTLAYTGCFEGNGKTIKNLKINSDKPFVGLFGAVKGHLDGFMKPASIKNLNLVDVDIVSNFDNVDPDNFTNAIGCLVGTAMDNSEIINIKANGQVAALNGAIGGIIGQMDGTHYTCNAKSLDFNGTVKSTTTVEDSSNIMGGCIGFVYNGITGDMHSSGNVTDEYGILEGNAYGGVVGRYYIGLITDSDSTATVVGQNYCGGVIGNLIEADCKNCHYTGNKVSASLPGYGVGGLIGCAGVAAITNCSVNCESVRGFNAVGGFIGDAYSSNISNCEAVISGKVISDIESEWDLPWATGGFMGGFGGNMSICKATVGSVESTGGKVGGFFGAINGDWDKDRYVKNCSCEVNSVKAGFCAGGFVGDVNYFSVVNCKAKVNGNIVTTSYDNSYYEDGILRSNAGGFAGTTGYYTIIAFCSTEFDSVICDGGYVYAGGFAANTWYTNISNCYAKGNVVRCADIVGGIIGSGTPSLNNCYTTVKVESEGGNVGEIMGYLHSIGEAHSCFSLGKGNGSIATVGDTNSTYGELYNEPDGYRPDLDWGSHPWSEDIWNLDTGSTPNLPTLKANPPFNKSDYPLPPFI